jgi:glucosamine--fructose-6-phosphate aminotransferase (isomerizing)
LKTELDEKEGLKPKSGTDTEIVALLIGLYLDKGNSLSLAINLATSRLEGAYSFVLISILEPENMYIFKNTGTIVIGLSDGLKASHQNFENIEELKEVELNKVLSSDSDQQANEF